MAGHAQLKFVMTECSKTQIRLTGLTWSIQKSKVVSTALNAFEKWCVIFVVQYNLKKILAYFLPKISCFLLGCEKNNLVSVERKYKKPGSRTLRRKEIIDSSPN